MVQWNNLGLGGGDWRPGTQDKTAQLIDRLLIDYGVRSRRGGPAGVLDQHWGHLGRRIEPQAALVLIGATEHSVQSLPRSVNWLAFIQWSMVCLVALGTPPSTVAPLMGRPRSRCSPKNPPSPHPPAFERFSGLPTPDSSIQNLPKYISLLPSLPS